MMPVARRDEDSSPVIASETKQSRIGIRLPRYARNGGLPRCYASRNDKESSDSGARPYKRQIEKKPRISPWLLKDGLFFRLKFKSETGHYFVMIFE